MSVRLIDSDLVAVPSESCASNTINQFSAVGNVTNPPQVSSSRGASAVGGISSKDENGRMRTASNVSSTSTVISTVKPFSSSTALPSTTPNGDTRTTMAMTAST